MVAGCKCRSSCADPDLVLHIISHIGASVASVFRSSICVMNTTPLRRTVDSLIHQVQLFTTVPETMRGPPTNDDAAQPQPLDLSSSASAAKSIAQRFNCFVPERMQVRSLAGDHDDSTLQYVVARSASCAIS